MSADTSSPTPADASSLPSADERPVSPLWPERALLTMGVVLLAFLLLETADGDYPRFVAVVVVAAVVGRVLLSEFVADD